MKLLEVLRNKSNKFFARNSICTTIKGGHVFVDDKSFWVPMNTRLTIEHFDLYKEKVVVLIDGRQKAYATYEYLMDCVLPVSTDTSQVVTALQVVQRTKHIIDKETLINISVLLILFIVGMLVGKVF